MRCFFQCLSDFSFRLMLLSCRLLVSCVAKTQFAGNLQFWCVSFLSPPPLSTHQHLPISFYAVAVCTSFVCICVVVCSVLTVKMVFKYLQSLSQMLEYMQILVILILSILFFSPYSCGFFIYRCKHRKLATTQIIWKSITEMKSTGQHRRLFSQCCKIKMLSNYIGNPDCFQIIKML